MQPGSWTYNVLPVHRAASPARSGQGVDRFSQAASRHADERHAGRGVHLPDPPARGSGADQLVRMLRRYYDGTGATFNPSPKVKTDYAANFGDTYPVIQLFGPTYPPNTYSEGDSTSFGWPDPNGPTGVSFMRSEVKSAQITDGQSNTILLGEKYIDPDDYSNGNDGGDDWTAFTGQQDDTYRTAGCQNTSTNPPSDCAPPTQDQAGNEGPSGVAFGSATSAC